MSSLLKLTCNLLHKKCVYTSLYMIVATCYITVQHTMAVQQSCESTCDQQSFTVAACFPILASHYGEVAVKSNCAVHAQRSTGSYQKEVLKYGTVTTSPRDDVLMHPSWTTFNKTLFIVKPMNSVCNCNKECSSKERNTFGTYLEEGCK